MMKFKDSKNNKELVIDDEGNQSSLNIKDKKDEKNDQVDKEPIQEEK